MLHRFRKLLSRNLMLVLSFMRLRTSWILTDCSVSKIGEVSSIEQSSSRVLVDENMLTSVNLQANGVKEQGGSEFLVNKKKQDLVNSLPQIEKQIGHEVMVANQGGPGLPTEAVTISRLCYVNVPITAALLSEPQHDIKLPEAAQSASQQISVPVESAAPSPGLVVASDLISSKNRRKRIRQKANKRLRAENKQDGVEITPAVVSVQNVTYDSDQLLGW